MITLSYESSSYEYHSEINLQANFDKSDQSFEKKEGELIEFKGKQHQESKHIEKELVPINSETMYLAVAS